MSKMEVGHRMYAMFEYLDSLSYGRALLLSTAAWYVLALFFALVSPPLSSTYRKLDARLKAEWLSYLNSSIHALHACVTSMYTIFGESDLFEGKPMSTLSFWRGSTLFTMGYFVCDSTLILTVFKRYDPSKESLYKHMSVVLGANWGSLAHHVFASLTAHWVLVCYY